MLGKGAHYYAGTEISVRGASLSDAVAQIGFDSLWAVACLGTPLSLAANYCTSPLLCMVHIEIILMETYAGLQDFPGEHNSTSVRGHICVSWLFSPLSRVFDLLNTCGFARCPTRMLWCLGGVEPSLLCFEVVT